MSVEEKDKSEPVLDTSDSTLQCSDILSLHHQTTKFKISKDPSFVILSSRTQTYIKTKEKREASRLARHYTISRSKTVRVSAIHATICG